MSPHDAAISLLTRIAAPMGAVTIVPWHEDSGAITMVVQIHKRSNILRSRIPSVFEGFPVRVEDVEPPIVERMCARYIMRR
jgi:hypothetical protein